MTRSGQVLLLACTAGLLLESAAFAALAIQVESSTHEYGEPAKFELSVTLQNNGVAPVVVLPQSLRREYVSLDAGIARYSPYPGPPIKPWRDAFLLRPGQSRTLAVRGMRDGDGVWNLDPGSYELSIRLSVTPAAAEASSSRVKDIGTAIWQGDIHSSSIRITYSPAPAAQLIKSLRRD